MAPIQYSACSFKKDSIAERSAGLKRFGGALAQLTSTVSVKQDVKGSNPLGSKSGNMLSGGGIWKNRVRRFGRMACWLERVPDKDEVLGSTPATPTI